MASVTVDYGGPFVTFSDAPEPDIYRGGTTQRQSAVSRVVSPPVKPGTELAWAVVISVLPFVFEFVFDLGRAHEKGETVNFSTLCYSAFAFSAAAFARAIQNHKSGMSSLLFIALVTQIALALSTAQTGGNSSQVVALIVSTVATLVGTLGTWWPDIQSARSIVARVPAVHATETETPVE